MRILSLCLFALATLGPALLLILGLALGSSWPYLALAYMALAALGLDLLIPLVPSAVPDQEFPAADVLLVTLGLTCLGLLPLMVWAVAGASGLSLPASAALFMAAGLWFGQVGHPAAHELIHRNPPLSWLGLAIYSALLFGHHASAHRLVHHRFVATALDPNSAREGESFYHFMIRAWKGSFVQGYRAETALRHGRGLHPYALYVGIALASLLLGTAIGGLAGVLVWLGFGLHMGSQILLSDYVQHYGLTRPMRAGKLVPVGAAHSWNTPHWYSAALMLNAPRHSDHHAHPSRPFTSLRLPPDAPLLPWPLPLAALIALSPRHWRKKMQPLVRRWAASSEPVAKE